VSTMVRRGRPHPKHELTAWARPNSVLGTPNDEIWPGVSLLPDYKPSFPQWNAVDLERAVPTLDLAGIDLLAVSATSLQRFETHRN